MDNRKTYTAQEVAERARISTMTLSRWAKAGKVPEPYRDRRGWRVFTAQDLRTDVRKDTEDQLAKHHRSLTAANAARRARSPIPASEACNPGG